MNCKIGTATKLVQSTKIRFAQMRDICRKARAMKSRITINDYIKANRIASRKEEIELHGKFTSRYAVHKSKKAYDRKRIKKGKIAILECENR